MAKILAPNEKFTGKRAGIPFIDGKAETDDDSAIRYFAKHGYKVEGYKRKAPKPAPQAPKAEDAATDPLAGLTVDDLKALAAEQDIDLGDAKYKDDIKAVIAAAAPVADSPQD